MTTRPIAEAEARLVQVMNRLVSRRSVPHALIGVARADESFRWIGACGPAAADGREMKPETPFWIASVTKLYIAAVIMQLHEQGAVQLEAPMNSYLPEDLIGGLHRLDGVDHTAHVTIRHLLSHTSGLPDYIEDAPRGGRSLFDRLVDGEDHSWDLAEVIRITRDDLRPHFAPRDLSVGRVRARYSDTNFQLLIGIIESVTGEPLHQVFQERIFGPLDLGDTYLPGRSHPDRAELGSAMLWSKDQPVRWPLATPCFNDLISTAADSLRFLPAFIRGELFADPGTAGLMQQQWNPIMYPLQYGLGMMRFRIGRVFASGSRPMTLIGHSGVTGTWLFHCPELDVFLTGTVDEVHSRAKPFRVMPKVLRALEA
jgi:D-alanyl-D-alanine carboxypeptidase